MRILDKNNDMDYSKVRRLKVSRLKRYIFLITFLQLAALSYGQEGTVSSGGEAKGTGGFMSFSIGQIDYINISSATAKITQGIQQPAEILISKGDPIIIDRSPEYILYPNPVKDDTVLYVDQPITQKMSYLIYDILGRVLVRERLIEMRTRIRTDQLPDAVYILTVVEDNTDKIVKKIKIIKKR